MNLIDTHCHLTFDSLAGQIDAVLARSVAAGVTAWITVGTDPAENQKALALAQRFQKLCVALGIHPHYADTVAADDIKALETLAQNPKCLAVGETGLDFHYDFSKRAAQMSLFTEHLDIAARLNLPVIIHSRQAFDETLEVLDRFGPRLGKIVFHCFSYSADQAKVILDKGYYISFTGVVTFKNADSVRQAAAIVPLDKMMIETDCPYMSPEPLRKQKVNEPALLIHTAAALARIKNTGIEPLASALTATSKSFFRIA